MGFVLMRCFFFYSITFTVTLFLRGFAALRQSLVRIYNCPAHVATVLGRGEVFVFLTVWWIISVPINDHPPSLSFRGRQVACSYKRLAATSGCQLQASVKHSSLSGQQSFMERVIQVCMCRSSFDQSLLRLLLCWSSKNPEPNHRCCVPRRCNL